MTAVPQPKPPRMTALEFIDWAMRTGFHGELLDGEPVAMAPENARHVRTKMRVGRALEDAVARAGLSCEALIDGMAVAVEHGTAFQPDAMVRCGPELPGEASRVEDAVIVVEVLSPSSISIDTSRKLLGYFRLPSVRHYLIVDPEKRMVIHHARDDGAGIATRLLGQGSLVLDPPGLAVDVADLFPPAPPPADPRAMTDAR